MKRVQGIAPKFDQRAALAAEYFECRRFGMLPAAAWKAACRAVGHLR